MPSLNLDSSVRYLKGVGPRRAEQLADLGIQTVRDLINAKRGWTSLNLMSPKAPTVAAYTRLRKRILQGKSDFLDNRVEPSSQRAHGGKRSLRTQAAMPAGGIPITKAAIDNELLYFAKGDHIWFSGWFYLEQGRASTIVDIESTAFFKGAGLRVLISPAFDLSVELKWPTRPTYRPTSPTRFPKQRWTQIRLHYLL